MKREGILSQRDKIIAQVKRYVPTTETFFDMDLTIKEYSHSLQGFKVDPVYRERQALIKKKIEEKFAKLFGTDYAKLLNFSFDDNLAWNIADRHMVLSHPFLISANFISSFDKINKKQKQNPIIVISSGDVPPNNYFSKSGFSFHGKKVPLFSVSEREFSTYYIQKRDFDFVERLHKIGRWNEFNQKEQAFLTEHAKFIDSLNFSSCVDYSDQISVLVRETWPLLFEYKLRSTLPELLYITQEELITECLIELLEGDGNFVSRCLFEKEFRVFRESIRD